ncbi:hypothetical protein [Pseudoroseomonas cervicalis]|uniref:hypothetical protein n=1 Tax=Teichococcus cervicalis TaxID=204525 RepID=UPI0022F1879A|nr:hypothetical protein [Pseudoroseomonas cervicalis]WBV45553.1 hypothetical protein PFY06_21310 [Pseudoroseomonas cervicalis]
MPPARPAPGERMRDAAPLPLPVLLDPALPQEGAWVALPLALLRRLPAVRGDGPLAYLGLAEQLAGALPPAPPARMTLSLAYVPARALPPRLCPGLASTALQLRQPGCIGRLLGLPPLDARAVRFGFRGARLTFRDGRCGEVVAVRERGGVALLVALGGPLGPRPGAAPLELPLHRFHQRVARWEGPSAPAKNP